MFSAASIYEKRHALSVSASSCWFLFFLFFLSRYCRSFPCSVVLAYSLRSISYGTRLQMALSLERLVWRSNKSSSSSLSTLLSLFKERKETHRKKKKGNNKKTSRNIAAVWAFSFLPFPQSPTQTDRETGSNLGPSPQLARRARSRNKTYTKHRRHRVE